MSNYTPSHDMNTVCPFCGFHHEAVTASPGSTKFYPDDGDATLCMRCGSVCIYDAGSDGGLRKPSKKEQRELAADENVQRVITAWKIVKRG